MSKGIKTDINVAIQQGQKQSYIINYLQKKKKKKKKI